MTCRAFLVPFFFLRALVFVTCLCISCLSFRIPPKFQCPLLPPLSPWKTIGGQDHLLAEAIANSADICDADVIAKLFVLVFESRGKTIDLLERAIRREVGSTEHSGPPPLSPPPSFLTGCCRWLLAWVRGVVWIGTWLDSSFLGGLGCGLFSEQGRFHNWVVFGKRPVPQLRGRG